MSCEHCNGSGKIKRQRCGKRIVIPCPHNVLHDLAAQYHQRTEAYDRTVCTGPMGRDGILPADGYERGLINSHARRVANELGAKIATLGFTPKQWQRAIYDAAHEMPRAAARRR